MMHRPEVGRTEGVEAFANGGPITTIACAEGHPRRVIERVRWDAMTGRGFAYTWAWRSEDPAAQEPPGTTAEDVPGRDEWKYRLRCPNRGCPWDVALSQASFDRLARAFAEACTVTIDLRAVAAIVG